MHFTDEELKRCRIANEIHDLNRELEMNRNALDDMDDDAAKYRELTDTTPVDTDWFTEQLGDPIECVHSREWQTDLSVMGNPVSVSKLHGGEYATVYINGRIICRVETRGQWRAFLFGCQIEAKGDGS